MCKKFFGVAIAVFLCVSCGGGVALAEVKIDAEHFPDDILRNFVSAFDLPDEKGEKDGVLTDAEIEGITMLGFLGSLPGGRVSSLKGIEYLTALTELTCLYNNYLLTSIDVSKNTALKSLSLGFTSITSLDISKNTVLTELCLDNNKLTSLDIGKNTFLRNLTCNSNSLKTLDVSKNTALTELWCDFNQLTSLDVSNNKDLITLSFVGNKISYIDVSKHTELRTLQTYLNPLGTLDISKNSKLSTLYCASSKLTKLDISNNPELTILSCPENLIKSFDVSRQTNLKWLYCENNPLPRLDLTNNGKLTDLTCSTDRVTASLRNTSSPEYPYSFDFTYFFIDKAEFTSRVSSIDVRDKSGNIVAYTSSDIGVLQFASEPEKMTYHYDTKAPSLSAVSRDMQVGVTFTDKLPEEITEIDVTITSPDNKRITLPSSGGTFGDVIVSVSENWLNYTGGKTCNAYSDEEISDLKLIENKGVYVFSAKAAANTASGIQLTHQIEIVFEADGVGGSDVLTVIVAGSDTPAKESKSEKMSSSSSSGGSGGGCNVGFGLMVLSFAVLIKRKY